MKRRNKSFPSKKKARQAVWDQMVKEKVAGLKCFDPEKISLERLAEAASLLKGAPSAKEVSLADLPQLDGMVTGSVAVTLRGHRYGKGEGYSDLEYGIFPSSKAKSLS